MGKSKPIILPSMTFDKQEDAKTFFSDMLNRYELDETVDKEDSKLLYELLQRHPNADIKIGSGISRFYVTKAEGFPTKCFHIERVIGEPTDFQLRACLTGAAPTIEQEFSTACRQAVNDKLRDQKEELFNNAPDSRLRCTKTGQLVSIHESDYRHTNPTFKEIVQRFIEEHQIDIQDVDLSVGGDLQYTTTFEDPDIERLFQKFHAKHAVLAIFHKSQRP